MMRSCAVDEPTADAIGNAYEQNGELAGVAELRRYFPLITDNIHARRCVRMIAGLKPFAPGVPVRAKKAHPHRSLDRTA